MQPWFMVEGMITYLMSCLRDLRKCFMITFKRSILPDNKESNLQIETLQKNNYSWNNYVEIGRKRLPAGITMGLHIRPLVVEVQRKACEWLFGLFEGRHNFFIGALRNRVLQDARGEGPYKGV